MRQSHIKVLSDAGKPGLGHVNEQPHEYVISRLEDSFRLPEQHECSTGSALRLQERGLILDANSHLRQCF